MSVITRKAGAIWNGDLKNGNGTISTESQSLYEQPYNYQTRFDGDNTTGSNPEELIAAAQAACFSMALSSTLKKKGYDPKQADTTATCTLASRNGGFEITHMQLYVRAEVPGIDQAAFQKVVKEADQSCPVSNLLREGLEIEIEAVLI